MYFNVAKISTLMKGSHEYQIVVQLKELCKVNMNV